jgi:hypothetical protein
LAGSQSHAPDRRWHASTTRIRNRTRAVDRRGFRRRARGHRMGIDEGGSPPRGCGPRASARDVPVGDGEPGMQDHAQAAYDRPRWDSPRHGRRPCDGAPRARQPAPNHRLAHASGPASSAPAVAASADRDDGDDHASAGRLHEPNSGNDDADLSGDSVPPGRPTGGSADRARTGRDGRRRCRWQPDESIGLHGLGRPSVPVGAGRGRPRPPAAAALGIDQRA